MPGDQPDYGMGDFPMGQPAGTPPYIPQQGVGQIGGIPTMQNQQAPQQAQEQRKPNRTLGIIGDALLGLGGQQGVFGPMMARRREQEEADKRQQAQLEQARAWSNQDWQARQDYERANPKPVNNDTTADYDFIREKLGDEAGQMFLRNKANPPQYRQGPDGRFYRIDTGGTAPQGVPTAPVGKLTPIGGPVSAPGTFRP